jgi:hypothetical protein
MFDGLRIGRRWRNAIGGLGDELAQEPAHTTLIGRHICAAERRKVAGSENQVQPPGLLSLDVREQLAVER